MTPHPIPQVGYAWLFITTTAIICLAQGLLGSLVATIVVYLLRPISVVSWAMFMAGWMLSLAGFLTVFLIVAGFIKENL